ncbi:MAG: (2Fe-2S)-binding protein [Bacteriovoracaceae bacterium]|nr:(2Fe-2S)-binding protein [Bacteriovoracaceae bacterium]
MGLDIDSQEKILDISFFTESEHILNEEFVKLAAWAKNKTVNIVTQMDSVADSEVDNIHFFPLFLFTEILRDYLGVEENLQMKLESKNSQMDDPIQCFCYGLTKKNFDSLQWSKVSLGQLKKMTKVTTGCGSCSKLVENILSWPWLKYTLRPEEYTPFFEKIFSNEMQDQYICKCFKTTPEKFMNALVDAPRSQYPMMGVHCQTCLTEPEDGGILQNDLSERPFYFQGKSWMEWGFLFDTWLKQHSSTLLLKKVQRNEVHFFSQEELSVVEQNYWKKELQQSFGEIWEIYF